MAAAFPSSVNRDASFLRLPRVLASRLICIYFFLYGFFVLSGILLDVIPPVGDFVSGAIYSAFDNAATWTAVHWFHLRGPVTVSHPTHSGDTTISYIHEFLMLVLAAALVLPWSLIGQLRRNERTVYPWVKLMVRLTLSYFLLSYGIGKIYPNQFEGPDLGRLVETYGESSPMGLMWTFMGASKPYQIFCGSLEASAGLLLLFRRTSTVGTLFGTAIMLNIVVLNLCFDVPVKILSSELFFMCLFLLWDDVKPLCQFFVLRRSTRLECASIPPFELKWLRYGRTALQILVPLWFLWEIVPDARTIYISGHTPRPELQSLRGIWEVEAGTGGNPQWNRVVLDQGRRIAVWTGEGQLLRFVMQVNASKHSLKFTGWRNDHVCEFSYELSDAQHLNMTGKIDQQRAEFKFHKVATPTFLLTTRGFHWISEDPYNF